MKYKAELVIFIIVSSFSAVLSDNSEVAPYVMIGVCIVCIVFVDIGFGVILIASVLFGAYASPYVISGDESNESIEDNHIKNDNRETSIWFKVYGEK